MNRHSINHMMVFVWTENDAPFVTKKNHLAVNFSTFIANSFDQWKSDLPINRNNDGHSTINSLWNSGTVIWNWYCVQASWSNTYINHFRIEFLREKKRHNSCWCSTNSAFEVRISVFYTEGIENDNLHLRKHTFCCVWIHRVSKGFCIIS